MSPTERHTNDELATACQHLARRVLALPAVDQALRNRITRLASYDPDGYPTSSALDSSCPSSEIDDDGTPIPPQSDPVGRLVTNREATREQAQQALNTGWRNLHHALAQIEAAHGTLDKAAPITTSPKPKATEDTWCKSCLRIKHFSPIYTKAPGHRLCDWCYRWWLAHGGELPHPALVDIHHRVGKVTQRDIDQHSPKAKYQRTKAKRKRLRSKR